MHWPPDDGWRGPLRAQWLHRALRHLPRSHRHGQTEAGAAPWRDPPPDQRRPGGLVRQHWGVVLNIAAAGPASSYALLPHRNTIPVNFEEPDYHYVAYHPADHRPVGVRHPRTRPALVQEREPGQGKGQEPERLQRGQGRPPAR